MNLVPRHQLHACQVARTQLQIAIAFLAGSLYQQSRLFHLQGVERLSHLGRLGCFQLKIFYDGQLAIGQLRRQRRAQRAQQLFAGKLIVIRARLRPMHRAAMAPQRRADRTHAGASGALLLPQFLAGARNQFAVLGGMGAGAQ